MDPTGDTQEFVGLVGMGTRGRPRPRPLDFALDSILGSAGLY